MPAKKLRFYLKVSYKEDSWKLDRYFESYDDAFNFYDKLNNPTKDLIALVIKDYYIPNISYISLI